MKLKFFVLLAIVSSMCFSCNLLIGDSTLEIQNKTDEILVIKDMTGIVRLSNEVNIKAYTNKVFVQNGRGEECRIHLLYKGNSYLIKTGYVQDTHNVFVSINNDGTYTVFGDLIREHTKSFIDNE